MRCALIALLLVSGAVVPLTSLPAQGDDRGPGPRLEQAGVSLGVAAQARSSGGAPAWGTALPAKAAVHRPPAPDSAAQRPGQPQPPFASSTTDSTAVGALNSRASFPHVGTAPVARDNALPLIGYMFGAALVIAILPYILSGFRRP